MSGGGKSIMGAMDNPGPSNVPDVTGVPLAALPGMAEYVALLPARIDAIARQLSTALPDGLRFEWQPSPPVVTVAVGAKFGSAI